jgi:16S rRNA (cytidine1402-2'-O)-methyltransferase
MSKLYIIPTPIGNLEDMTHRAIRILKEVDLILAEDTRNSAKLLKHFQISTRMLSFHQFNEHKTLQGIVSRIASGEKIALISDAGTPGISDPGFILVRECVRNGLDVECLPGPTAFVPALINSGLASDRFVFEGFLPHKKGRKSRLEILAQSPYTLVFYESPFRLVKALEQFVEYFGGDRQASVSRELTKIHEENKRGALSELLDYFSNKKVLGEIVIIVGGKI